jgi:phytoene synthase
MPVSQRITRRSASNLALAFVMLPKVKRDSMAALYAFCRQVDDIADDETMPAAERRALLAAWREDIKLACEQGSPQFPVNQELQPVIQRYHLPFAHFEELVRGMEMDLEIHRYEDDAALELYCYRVASVVGLLSIEIFGYQDRACRQYAISLGQALQLTNILRDIRTDALRGRIYLPLQTLARYQVPPDEILALTYSPRFVSMATHVAQQARRYYQSARETLPPGDRPAMVAAELMGAVYWRLLCKMEARRFAVFDATPIRLGKARKLFLILRTWLGPRSGAWWPRYGKP